MKLLDLTCNDGWMLANLWSGREEVGGFERLDGMELNTGAAERARERQREHGWPGKIVTADLHTAPEHFEEGSYDGVVLFETIEHVPDPAATLDLCVRMAKPEGRVYVSTPDGAYERGNVAGWARVESKGHLRAMRPHDLCSLLCERGVIENFEVEQRVMVASLRPVPRKGKVIFYAGAADCLPEQITTTGLGGSETALAKMAEHFARRGYDVRVYAGLGGGIRGDRITVEEKPAGEGQVLYAPEAAWDPGEACDLFVSSRIPEAFDRTINAPQRVLWLHDADYADRLTELRAARTTAIVVMSEFQRELLTGRYPFIRERVEVSRNGIETGWYRGDLPEKEPIVVYSSSPDRGLDVLLECWPEIRKRVPEAELHFGYAPFYQQAKDAFPHLQAFHARLTSLQEGLEGLRPFDSLPQHHLADLYKRAKVWAYPSWTTPSKEPFPEISCISAMEAQAAGCIPVTLDYGALRETVRSGVRIDPDIVKGRLSGAWRDRFVAAVVKALREGRPDEDAREWALGLDWSGVCDQWEALFGLREPEPVAA